MNETVGLSTVQRGAAEQDYSTRKTALSSNPLPLLPPDLWAEVLPFLPLSAALQCTAVCRAFLHDVAPLVKEVSVIKSGELRVKFARRFRGVRKVQIGCLFKYPAMTPRQEFTNIDFDCISDIRSHLFGQLFEEEYMYGRMIGLPINDIESDDFQIDDVVVSRTTPFLTAFTNLREADIGGFFVLCEFGSTATPLGVYEFYGEKLQQEVEDDDEMLGAVYRDESTRREDGEFMRALEMSIGGAYSSGAISQRCDIHGVGARCPKVESQICAHCVRISKCFPVAYAAKRFLWEASWIGGPMETLERNKSTTAIECLRTLLARREGTEYLKSEEYLYKMVFSPQGCLRRPVYQQALGELVRFSQIDRQTVLKLWYRRISFYEENARRLITRRKSFYEGDARRLIALGLPVKIFDVEMLKEMKEERKKRRKRRKKRRRFGHIRQLSGGIATGRSAFGTGMNQQQQQPKQQQQQANRPEGESANNGEPLQMIMNAAPSQDIGKQQGQEQHPLDNEQSPIPKKSKFEQLMEGVPYLDSEEEKI